MVTMVTVQGHVAGVKLVGVWAMGNWLPWLHPRGMLQRWSWWVSKGCVTGYHGYPPRCVLQRWSWWMCDWLPWLPVIDSGAVDFVAMGDWLPCHPIRSSTRYPLDHQGGTVSLHR